MPPLSCVCVYIYIKTKECLLQGNDWAAVRYTHARTDTHTHARECMNDRLQSAGSRVAEWTLM